jgi:Leucine rich repeat
MHTTHTHTHTTQKHRLDFTSNNLKECTALRHLTKLRRLVLDKNRLESVDLSNLGGLEKLSLADNRLQSVPSLTDLRKLVNLDMSGNQVSSGFEQIQKAARCLRVLDLSRNSINMSLGEFSSYVLAPLKAVCGVCTNKYVCMCVCSVCCVCVCAGVCYFP